MKKTFIVIGLLVSVATAAFYLGGIRFRNRKIAAENECAAYKARLHSPFSLEAEKARLEARGLDIDFSAQGGSGDGVLLVSSSRLDHNQKCCRLFLAGGVLVLVTDD